MTMPPVPPVPATVTRTCRNCAYFVSKDDDDWQNALINGKINADICSIRQRVISASDNNTANVKAQEKIATECPQYKGAPVEGPPHQVETISLGIPVANQIAVGTHKAASCATCAFMTTKNNIDGIDTNTSLQICGRKGLAIVPGMGTSVASKCDVSDDRLTNLDDSVRTANTVWTINLHDDLIPEDGENVNSTDDPLDYPTDMPVTDKDKEDGIKAWRKVESESGTVSLMMPIFDPNSFSDEERKKIPRPGDQEMPELYIDHLNLLYQFLAIWKMEQTPALSGTSGVGKTEVYRYAAYMMQLPFERFSINNSTEIDDLAGRMHFSKETGTYFEPGRIPKAWAKRCVTVIDEPNVGPPDVWQFLRPLFDNSKQLVLDVNRGERIERNQYCYLGLAMNPAWDVRNVGTHEISDADGRRLMHIFVPPPDSETEKKIIYNNCENDGYRLNYRTYRSIENISKDIRSLCENDTIPIQWGVAQNIKVARASRYFDLTKCFKLAAADLISPEASEVIMATVASHITGRVG